MLQAPSVSNCGTLRLVLQKNPLGKTWKIHYVNCHERLAIAVRAFAALV
jgi:hypothetical protein